MLNYGSLLGYAMKFTMLLLVPFNLASTKVLQWMDSTSLFSTSRSTTGNIIYEHPLWSSYALSFGPKDILPTIVSTTQDNKVRRMFFIKNSRMEKILYRGVFSSSALRKKLVVLFVYVDKEQCTSFFDNCYVSCEVTGQDVMSLVGIQGSTVRVIDDCFEESIYSSEDVVFSI